ncbi:hypothetical protein [Nocardioides sp.]|uniref:hypothetical protein n=1 Tax=Nocardioides sp. TaxID=35761 RepID=UPI0039E602E0
MTAVDPVYDDPATPAEMLADCLAAEAHLSFPHDRADLIARAAGRPVPSLRFEDFPREVPKPELHPAVAAQRIAAALELDLD